MFIEKVAFDSHSLTAHNHAGKKDDHDEITILYDADHKEFIDQESSQPLYKQIHDQSETNINNHFNAENKTKTLQEENIKLTNLPLILHNNTSHHSHKHPHNQAHIHNKHNHHTNEEIVNKAYKNGVINNNENANINNELNVDKFVLNETENGDYLDQNIDEGKHTTRPRVNTFDQSKLPINQMRKHLNGVLLQENSKQINKMKKKSHRKNKILDANCEHDHLHNDESDSDLEEATLKNVVSSKGKFLSLLQARNICKINIYIILFLFLIFFFKKFIKF